MPKGALSGEALSTEFRGGDAVWKPVLGRGCV